MISDNFIIIGGYKFRNHLFWDVNVSEINEKKSRVIIERVLTRGDLYDLKSLIQLYGLNFIINEAIGVKTINIKTINYLKVINFSLV